MNLKRGNIFSGVKTDAANEVFETLLSNDAVRLERIVSCGQATAEGEWCDQERDEWVLLLKGEAELSFGEQMSAVELRAGDYVLIPAHCRHRVQWTSQTEPAIWLALHF